MREGPSWRAKVFWSAFVVFYAAAVVRIAYEFLKPVLPWLCPLAVLSAVLWMYVSWRRSRW